MRTNKGLFIDGRPEEQPEGTYPFGKNGIQHDLNGVSFNEPGFKKLQVLVPYKINGIIQTDSKPIIFSTDNTNSAVGFFNPETELYEPIINDGSTDWIPEELIGFKIENYITGRATRNYKGELVVAFTDKTLVPMYLNCDNPDINSINDLKLFPSFRVPTIDVEEALGGRLTTGAYFVAGGYEKNDGTSTAYSAVSQSTIITPSEGGTVTDKALSITITNVDTSYDYMRIAIISKVQGVTRAVELLDYLPVAGDTLTFTYTGDELTQDIDVSSVLVAPAIYNRVGTIGQLNDHLYIGDLSLEPDLNDMQIHALAITLEFQSEIINATAPPPEHVAGKKKSFMHEEVYAFYVRYRKALGGFTKWFAVAGPTPLPADLAPSTEAIAGGETTPVPKFKVEDTIPYFDVAAKTGSPGVWQNETERYPDTPDFDATSLGGRNLRNQLVLHHKMPTLRWCKQNLYSSNINYGKTDLDLLGIRATNIRIPDKYVNIIDGYEIGYAKRTVGNMTVYGQSALLHGVVNNYDKDIPTDGGATIYTSGGNWRTSIWHKGDNSFNNNFELVQLRTDTFRFHAFDILFNKPSIEPTFISAQFKMKRENLRSEGYIEDGEDNANLPTAFLVDYTIGNTPIVNLVGTRLRKIKESLYMPVGINTMGFVNARHEHTFAGTLLGNEMSISYGDAGLRVKGQSYTEANVGCPAFEETYLINLIAVKTDLYNRFYGQRMISAGESRNLNSIEPFWGGDTFLCDYTFHTYGRHETNDGWGDGNKGKKVIRRIVCESTANIHLRYEIIGNQYSKWYPNDPVQINTTGNTTYVIFFDRSQDPNQFGYDASLSGINDLIDSTTYNPFREEQTEFPYRIHRGGRNTRTGRPRSWRTFLPLDFYEMIKTMGKMINLEGMDDRLLIHMENSLFVTQDKAVLESSEIAITLGSGDIFQFEPQEVMSAQLGYGGTQHDLACVRTPWGYIFVDAKQGEIYSYKGELQNINGGLNTFLRDYLKVPEVNVFTGNGITIGWDQKYKRILLTIKNRIVPDSAVVKQFEDTPEFWASLSIGDIVFYKNRYIQYVGLNNPTETGYNCPIDPVDPVYTWEPYNVYCIMSGGINTGFQAWSDRRRKTNGVLDGVSEPNLINEGAGPYFPPQFNLDACPKPAPVITWVGSDSYCIPGVAFACQEGWTLSDDGTYCYIEEMDEAIPPSVGEGIVAKANSIYWNNGGTRVYAPGYPISGVGTILATLTTPHFWLNGTTPGDPFNTTHNTVDSRMNASGIWIEGSMPPSGDWLPMDEWVGFSRKFNVPTAKTYYIGISADNVFRIKINGITIISSELDLAHKQLIYWHIYPVQLQAGDNIIEMTGMNKSQEGVVDNPGGFGAEIYDMTYEQIIAATEESDLNIIFTTSNFIGEPLDIGDTVGWSCPPGWALDTSGSGDPVCRRIITEAPSEEPAGNSGDMGYNTRCREVDGEPDGFCEPNTETGGEGPFIPPIENLEACPIEPPEPPDPPTISGTVEKFCSDVNCTEQGDISLKFTFDTPLPANLEIYAGEITRTSYNGQLRYQGSEIFTPPVGAVPKTTAPTSPYIFSIPADTTVVTVTDILARDLNTAGFEIHWSCHNCQGPITDIYLKINEPIASFILNLTSVTTGVTVHNVNG